MKGVTTSPPTPIEPAATLILLRSSGTCTEILMQVRHSGMAFAGGALVFPGGKIEAQDSDTALEGLIDDIQDEEELRPAKIAAIRETFEECGLLLARSPGEPRLINGEQASRLARDRQSLNRGDMRFVDILRRDSLRIACGSLVHFAHWITPDFMPRRFDTHFFLAHAPESQQEAHDGEETVESVWIRPEDAIDAATNGRYKMLFPTRSILHRLCGDTSPPDHLQEASRTPVVTVAPQLVKRKTGTFVQIPDNIGYGFFEEQVSKD